MKALENLAAWWDRQGEQSRRAVFYTAWFWFGFVMGAIAL
jgi:hypothetical protein